MFTKFLGRYAMRYCYYAGANDTPIFFFSRSIQCRVVLETFFSSHTHTHKWLKKIPGFSDGLPTYKYVYCEKMFYFFIACAALCTALVCARFSQLFYSHPLQMYLVSWRKFRTLNMRASTKKKQIYLRKKQLLY